MATEPVLVAFQLTALQRRHSVRSYVLSDYWELTKPEVNFLIAMTTVAAFCLGSSKPFGHFPWFLLLNTLLGTVLVASGAGALNQLIERKFDAQMRRTAGRPIAAGRIEPIQALIFGSLLSLAGTIYLALAVRPTASLLALLTLSAYLFFYTPLKRRTSWCTLAGAFPGAMPVLIGYVAATGRLDSQAWLLYSILFLWQFPHFMAIAWMYREDYERAGYEVLPPGTKKARIMGWQSVLPALALVSVAFAPMALRHANPVFVAGTLLLSLGFLYFAARLALIRSSQSARRLLLVSILYLPLALLLVVLAKT
jgi:protoheme IX farnesyltransferase